LRQELGLPWRDAPTLAFLLCAAASLIGCGAAADANPEGAYDAVIVLPALPGRPASGYFGLRARADRVALTGVSSPRAKWIEMHESFTRDGMVSMRPVAPRQIRDQDIRFAPGSAHLMLFELDPALKVGDRVQLIFHFDQGEPISGQAAVRDPGGEAHGGH